MKGIFTRTYSLFLLTKPQNLKFSRFVFFFLLFLGSFFVFGAGKADAATYTVCSSGCDQTAIQGAFDNYDLAPGDIVEVRADTEGGSKTYNEMVTWGTNDYGAANGQVVLRGREGDIVAIDGGSIRNYSITAANELSAYITIQNFILSNYVSRGIWLEGASGALQNGIIIADITATGGVNGIWLRNKSNSSLTDSVVSGASGHGVAFSTQGVTTPSDLTIDGLTVSDCGGLANYGQFYIENYANVSISDVTSYGSTASSGLGLRNVSGAITLTSCNLGQNDDGNTLYGLFINSCSGILNATNINASFNTSYGIYLLDSNLAEGSYINDSTVASNGNVGVAVINNDNVAIEASATANAGHGFLVDTGSTSIELSGSSYLNTGSASSGVRIKGGSSFIDVSSMRVYSNPFDGISIADNATTDVTVKNCEIYSNGTNGQVNSGDGLTSHDASSNIYFYGNIVYSNENSCIAVVGSGSGRAWNNACYFNGNSTFAGTRGGYFNQCTSGAWSIRNNVFSGSYPYEVSTTSDGWVATDTNYNQYFHTGNGVTESTFATLDGGSTMIGWGDYQSRESNSQYGNPLFVTPDTNFQLSYNSPAIDSGTDVSLTSDYAGNPIYGTPDIGAYEYQPPYTVGSTPVPQTGSIRIYSDGQYRALVATTTADTITTSNFSVVPAGGGFYTASTSAFMDLSINTWETAGDKNKSWTATSTEGAGNTHATSTVYTIGDLIPDSYYTFKIDNTATTTAITGYGATTCQTSYGNGTNLTCLSDSSGIVQF
ncbi:MAG: right-handed parallel beta-helix repeat-containing protein, partial [Patescibacteria group bacterium]